MSRTLGLSQRTGFDSLGNKCTWNLFISRMSLMHKEHKVLLRSVYSACYIHAPWEAWAQQASQHHEGMQAICNRVVKRTRPTSEHHKNHYVLGRFWPMYLTDVPFHWDCLIWGHLVLISWAALEYNKLIPFPSWDDNTLSSSLLFLFLGQVTIPADYTDKLGQSGTSQTHLGFPFAHALAGSEARLLLTILK